LGNPHFSLGFLISWRALAIGDRFRPNPYCPDIVAQIVGGLTDASLTLENCVGNELNSVDSDPDDYVHAALNKPKKDQQSRNCKQQNREYNLVAVSIPFSAQKLITTLSLVGFSSLAFLYRVLHSLARA
jgi:hypothetical protein